MSLYGSERAMSYDIAIIGMSCQFPGADNPRAYWDLLFQSRSAITEVPPSRWDVARFYDPDPSVPGKVNTKWGGFLAQPGGCDHAFFNLSADEAVYVDPQQRLILELGWEALEDAGIPPDSLKGSRTGVYVGISHNDYERIIYRDYRRITQYHGTGSYQSVAANRLSYFLNLTGPSVAVDTACASALTAIHMACNTLRAENLPLALVGAVTLHLTPDETIGLTKGRMLSGSGLCKSFDAGADGYVRGEGGGVLVLKRLEDALRDGDRVYGVVKGGAINHNGRSNGLSAPSVSALRAVMEQGLQSAGAMPEEVSFLEAYGSGTLLGDQIELKAIREVYDKSSPEPLWLGCVKANIGHLEPASGMASVIKVLLAMRHGCIPANLHFKGTSTSEDTSISRLHIPTTTTPWQTTSSRRLAAVTARGFGGANAHLLLESPPPEPASVPVTSDGVLLCLSAREEPALRALLRAYLEVLATPAAALADICYTACAGRNHFGWRAAFVGRDREALYEQLAAALRQDTVGRRAARPPSLALWFGGSVSRGVADALSAHHAVFREAFAECQVLAGTAPGAWANFAAQYALARLLLAIGVTPTALGGEGSGRLVVGVLSGAVSLEDAVALHADPRCGVVSRPSTLPLLAANGTVLSKQAGYDGAYLRAESPSGEALPASHVLLMIGTCVAPVGEPFHRLFADANADASYEDLLCALQALYQLGVKINWTHWYAPRKHRKVSLPGYPFQRKEMWFKLEPDGEPTATSGMCQEL